MQIMENLSFRGILTIFMQNEGGKWWNMKLQRIFYACHGKAAMEHGKLLQVKLINFHSLRQLYCHAIWNACKPVCYCRARRIRWCRSFMSFYSLNIMERYFSLDNYHHDNFYYKNMCWTHDLKNLKNDL